MRLESIKLAGFKSFVDATTVPFPGNLTAVVGPNGCGKSNIIDAVRWVMGESSAKQLRGESLDDVIFNGCTTRKPVGQASIELVFDNSDQTLVGQYAHYNQLSVRREITRDGQSVYYLNGTRCRRKDIVDIFLGTGLGPRSYAIIEQGMISRVVEAKPDDLRAYIEEAAGISKYKERRRETELRIDHTKDNLARLNDIRDELEKQLNHLQRQANAAERYKLLKQEERLLKAQIHVLRWQTMHTQLSSQSGIVSQHEADLAAGIEAQQQIEAALIQQREQQAQATQQSNQIQEKYYELGNEVTKLEQAIKTQQERNAGWRQELATLVNQLQHIQQQQGEAEQQQVDLNSELASLTPQLEQAKRTAEQSQLALKQAELALQDWQIQWDAFNREAAQIAQQAQVEQTRIQHLEQRLHAVQQRITRLEHEYQEQTQILTTDAQDDLTQQLAQLYVQHGAAEQQLQNLLQQIANQRDHNQHFVAELDAAKNQVQTLYGQQASLESLQQAALGQREERVVEWLQQHQIQDLPRLAQLLEVESGWERAVEVVLERYLQAVCVDDLNGLGDRLSDLPQGNLTLVGKVGTAIPVESRQGVETLNSKVQAPWSLASLITGIYVVDTITEALQLTTQLTSQESVITRDGVWLGNGWMYAAQPQDAKAGILKRERELHQLNEAVAAAEVDIEQKQAALVLGQNQLRDLEEQRTAQQQVLSDLVGAQAELRAQQQVKQARFAQAEQRAQQINVELQDCTQQLETDQEVLGKAQQAWQEAQHLIEQQTVQREMLSQTKNESQAKLDAARNQSRQDQESLHQLALRLQAAQMQLETTVQTKERLEQQLQELIERQKYLQQTLQDSEAPLVELTQQLQGLLTQRAQVEVEFNQAKQNLEQLDQSLRALEKQRHEVEQRVLSIRGELEQVRLNGQALEVRAKGLEEQIVEQGYELQALVNELPTEANETTWEEQLAQATRRIERLGPINLAAIDEYTVQESRKKYLDEQHADLIDALATLEDAMGKMDQETKERFKETYDFINKNFQELFPRLFGGGRASLDLMGDDWLTAGISMMAQPPGKRNSTIHLLSGGEKALTAIALVFSLFQLNPAPFCMLDEVDAPLDDANVIRFCNLVKEMSDKIQFIFISHNKLAIEMANHLAGVTMHEAGVSRMVAVDVDEAIALAGA